MSKLTKGINASIKNKKVADVFSKYPESIREKLFQLRQLLLDTALEIDGVKEVEETLKWGEPSYLVKGGSTIRMAWKESKPNEYALYFNCKTKLVDTFREIYRDKLNFEGNRAVLFNEGDEIPTKEIKHCILLALTYHGVKHLPLLGV